MEATVFGLQITSGVFALGAITGMTYGLLAVGLVLVYRANRVINLAHGEIGAFGAALCGVLVVRWRVPYWAALLAALAASALVGASTEAVVVRRLRHAPKLMSLVATLGVAQFLLAFSGVVNAQARAGSTFPQPPGLPQFRVGALLITQAYAGMLFLSPVIVFGLAAFLRWSRTGMAMRAAAANPDRARMAGVPARRMSTSAWAIAGGVAAFTTVLIIPTRGFISAETLGPVLLLRALAPAVIARMSSLPVALGAGVGLGLIDQILVFNHPTSGVSEVVLLAIIVVGLLAQGRRPTHGDEREQWAALQPWPAVRERFTAVPSIRYLGRIVAAASLTLALGVGVVQSNSAAVTTVAIMAFGLLGLSVGVVTGLGGQLSLGQFALAGVGAIASFAVVDATQNFLLAVIAAGAAAGIMSLALGLPALRVRGLLLGVVTLSFALASQRWLFAQEWAFGDGVTPRRPVFGALALDTTRRYYFFALAALVLGLWLAWNIWRGGVGLRLRATRDNEDAARAFGVSATAVKLQGFVVAGVLAGMAGSVYAHLLSRVNAPTFDVGASINVMALSVLGGIGLLAGPLLGALYIIGLPRFVPLDNAVLAATALGWLLLILYFPGGIAQIVAFPRRWLIERLAKRHGLHVSDDVEPASTTERPVLGTVTAVAARPGAEDRVEVVRAEALVKRYGGIAAVDGVSFEVRRSEILGLIGPNGAGKTTLFGLLSGSTSLDSGRVHLRAVDVTRTPAHRRARLGLIRSFQDAALFPTLTVLESITLALERSRPTNVIASTAGWQRRERAKVASAREIVSVMRLDRYRDTQILHLSTGTRRIADLACIVALQPDVLLLDEPSSGIAQRESEALGELLVELRQHLDCTMIVIEHDMPLLMGIATRVMAMDSGRLIAQGSPDEVKEHPDVVASYLGADLAAVARSGAAVTAADAT